MNHTTACCFNDCWFQWLMQSCNNGPCWLWQKKWDYLFATPTSFLNLCVFRIVFSGLWQTFWWRKHYSIIVLMMYAVVLTFLSSITSCSMNLMRVDTFCWVIMLRIFDIYWSIRGCTQTDTVWCKLVCLDGIADKITVCTVPGCFLVWDWVQIPGPVR